MPFSLTRPSSPTGHPPHPTGDFAAAVNRNAASTLNLHLPDHEMILPSKEKDIRPRIEVHLDSDCLFLKGTGLEVEPARISGRVALYLSESTSIKEITLQFRGKARIPLPGHESHSFNGSTTTYLICSHEWSFLEGERKHNHTLKAGRHFFPFQLQVGGSLPSSLWTDTLGGAAIGYKFRASAVRPGLNSNLQTVVPITLIRSLTPEALEYQQTLEIENTWPGKVMYSIMIPHKAYAIGDNITAVVKFSPLTKGTRVLKVTSTIQETVKLSCRNSQHEKTRTIATAKHEFIDGNVVEVVPSTLSAPQTSSQPSGQSTTSSHPSPSTGGSYFPTVPSASGSSSAVDSSSSTPAQPAALAGSSSAPQEDLVSSNPCDNEPSSDVIAKIPIPIPESATASHGLAPINVSHRIRWSILIGNLDGHTSELRCSLPILLLEPCLLEEARSFTLATRRLLLDDDERRPDSEDESRELPSYNAHIRDRIANQYLNEAATVRVPNAWVHNHFSPTMTPAHHPTSGTSTPLDFTHSTLPHLPSSGPTTPLDWVNSELLMSLHNPGEEQESQAAHDTPPDSDSNPQSRNSSRTHSRTHSRRASRRSSPERHIPGPAGSHISGPNEVYVHGESQASRNLHGVFNAAMKPFTGVATHSHWFTSRPSFSGTGSTANSNDHHHHHHHYQQPQHLSNSSRSTSMTNLEVGQTLHRAFTEVPDYGVASRGFIGGVPPLSSLQGLPSYEEAQSQGRHSESANQPEPLSPSPISTH